MDSLDIFLQTLSFPIKGNYRILDLIKEHENFNYPQYKMTKKEGKLFIIGELNKQVIYLDTSPLLNINCIYDLNDNVVFTIADDYEF